MIDLPVLGIAIGLILFSLLDFYMPPKPAYNELTETSNESDGTK